MEAVQDFERSRFACLIASSAVLGTALGMGAYGIIQCLSGENTLAKVTCSTTVAVAATVFGVPALVITLNICALRVRKVKPTEQVPLQIVMPKTYGTLPSA